MNDLTGVRILLGTSGSVAVYKAAEWARELVKEEAIVTTLMTAAAQQFVTPLTFAALTGNSVYSNMFSIDPDGVMAHINLSRENDVLLVAPATAQTISRLATGSAEDLLSAVVLAAKIPVVICPAMNTNMYTHPATQENLHKLIGFGYRIVKPDSGSLACGETGEGRLAGWDTVRELLLSLLTPQDLLGQKIVITAGPTQEPIDPARYITNRSSGKMGYALARVAQRRGAEVTLITGPVHLPPPPGITCVHILSAEDMENAVMDVADKATVIIKAAAVADYRPAEIHQQKMKKYKEHFSLELDKNNDILAELGKRKKDEQVLVGFAAESQNHDQEGRRKLREKNLDLIAVNDILGKTTGFDVDTNQVLLIDREDSTSLPLMSKENTASHILNKIVDLLNRKGMLATL
ncbi:bifunctional phosphopantothenoylcysteine decarboxylase/phosphopantothenate--cysteine ligase CoaBC [Desulfogranum japonicum]|uniref:bifunctional phosphopantothenoylcysteine decarboxylase/phosphopantothenate--cysteine ligase CoaBC n=1 Tax=Desulfogranum japonicum TaxID=231447 RepID=UPI0003FDAF56|nr:bifunctional phosphopantothenoylcysteine decarboxylase/phosphopantothenate--cysteine ligase CoaBC [Desulfogranum japonicum]